MNTQFLAPKRVLGNLVILKVARGLAEAVQYRPAHTELGGAVEMASTLRTMDPFQWRTHTAFETGRYLRIKERHETRTAVNNLAEAFGFVGRRHAMTPRR